MSSILSRPDREYETTMQHAQRRAIRFTILACVAAGALFTVLAVKAQVAPERPHWDLWPGYEQMR